MICLYDFNLKLNFYYFDLFCKDVIERVLGGIVFEDFVLSMLVEVFFCLLDGFVLLLLFVVYGF